MAVVSIVIMPATLAQAASRTGQDTTSSADNKDQWVRISGVVFAINSVPTATPTNEEKSLVLRVNSYEQTRGSTYYFESAWSTLILFGSYTTIRWSSGAQASVADMKRGVPVVVTGGKPGGGTNIYSREIVLLQPEEMEPIPPAGPAAGPGAPVIPDSTQSWPCNGDYPGIVTRTGNRMTVELERLDSKSLSSYTSVMPLTGGTRVMVYYDTRPAQGAEYCLFIYRDYWTLRRISTKPGFFNVEIGSGSIKSLKADSALGVAIEFDARLIPENITRCWNVQRTAH